MRVLTDPFISVYGAARLLGCSRETLYSAIARGELTGRVIAGRHVILRADMEHFIPPNGRRRDSERARQLA